MLGPLQSLGERISILGTIDGAEQEAFAEWGRLVDEWRPQSRGDPTARLDAGFRDAHATCGPVLAIGTDRLKIEPIKIERAFELLRDPDVVFSPTGNGGNYLVDLTRRLGGFFDRIRWLSTDTLRDHISRCYVHDWRAAFLPVKADIETSDDWWNYRERNKVPYNPGSRAPAPGSTLPSLVVPIPVLNEEAFLPFGLKSLGGLTIVADRLIVVDGGFRDRTRDVAWQFGAEFRFAVSIDRGNQSAAGVEMATEHLALLGHADMCFAPHSLEAIGRYMLEHPQCRGSALGHRFAS